MENPYSIVLTTTATQEEAEFITQQLLLKKLAACIHISPTTSHYVRNGKLEVAKEYVLSIKTRTRDFEVIQKVIKENHSYDIPQIIQTPITD
ncbi:divalent-cation tolerance protein CutA [bacterium]|nr:divalent-cation tolerance protein CutA [bacterium]